MGRISRRNGHYMLTFVPLQTNLIERDDDTFRCFHQVALPKAFLGFSLLIS